MIAHERTVTAVTAIQGAATFQAGRRRYMGDIIMRKRIRDIFDVSVATDAALSNGVAGRSTSCSFIPRFVLMFTLRKGSYPHKRTAGAGLHQLAVGFAGSFPDDYTLPVVIQRIHVIALFNCAAIDT